MLEMVIVSYYHIRSTRDKKILSTFKENIRRYLILCPKNIFVVWKKTIDDIHEDQTFIYVYSNTKDENICFRFKNPYSNLKNLHI